MTDQRDEHRLVQAARALAETLERDAAKVEREGISRARLDVVAKQGLIAPSAPLEFGGLATPPDVARRITELLAGGCTSFRQHCVEGLRANKSRIETLLDQSLMLVTALTPAIGYDRACAIAKHAHNHQLSLKEAALVLGEISAEEFDRWVQPEQMV
jgi:hypothetical protein